MVFDDHMRASARVLANHCLMGGGIDAAFGDVGGGGQGGGTGLQGMDALRQGLVSSCHLAIICTAINIVRLELGAVRSLFHRVHAGEPSDP